MLLNIEMLYKSQEKVINLLDDYSTIASNAKYKRRRNQNTNS